MSLITSVLPMLKRYALRFVIVMVTCLLLAYLVNLIFDIDMHKEFIFAGAMGMVVPSAAKKYVPVKQ